MPVARPQHYVRPVIVEVKPSNAGSNLAPSTPSPPSSPKAVRFADSKALDNISRQLSSAEAWSLYHFENHARQCPECRDPLTVYLSGRRLCDKGHDLAQDVAIHVYHKAGEIYSTEKDDHKPVRVELPPNYDQVRGLLKGMERRIKSKPRVVPIVSYDSSYVVSPRRPSADHEHKEYAEERDEVIIEPADSQKRHRSGRKSKRKSNGYKTTVVEDVDSEAELATKPAKPRERRGSLYFADKQRKATKDYDVVIREPESLRRNKEDRRDSGFWY